MVGAHAGVIVFANLPTHIHSINLKKTIRIIYDPSNPVGFKKTLKKENLPTHVEILVRQEVLRLIFGCLIMNFSAKNSYDL